MRVRSRWATAPPQCARPLDTLVVLPGDVAEWLRSGLQSRLHRFDSGRRLWDTARLSAQNGSSTALNGDLSGDYVVEDHRPDGCVLLRADLSVRVMLARHGECRLTPEEFEQHFGQLPTDGEG
jgi:hypothetical protein